MLRVDQLSAELGLQTIALAALTPAATPAPAEEPAPEPPAEEPADPEAGGDVLPEEGGTV